MTRPVRLLYLVTEDWAFMSHRFELGKAAVAAGYEVHLASRLSGHEETIRAAGIAVHRLEMGRGIGRPLAELAAIFSLLRRVRPDILHNVALKPALFGSLAARLAGVPAIVNAVAGLGYSFINRGGRAALLRPVILVAARLLFGGRKRRVIVQNEDDKALFDRLVGTDHVRLIRGSGADVERLPPLPEPPGIPVAALVARLLWDKGVGELVEAARLLREGQVPIRVVLVGKPDPANPRNIPEETVQGWVADGLVEWWGHRDDIAAVWAAAHIAVLPSYREGLPKALLEAAACGRPLLATDVPGCNELVRNEDNGLLVPARRPGPLAEALARLAQDPALRLKLGARARQRAEEEFSTRLIVGQQVALYQSLCPTDVDTVTQ